MCVHISLAPSAHSPLPSSPPALQDNGAAASGASAAAAADIRADDAAGWAEALVGHHRAEPLNSVTGAAAAPAFKPPPPPAGVPTPPPKQAGFKPPPAGLPLRPPPQAAEPEAELAAGTPAAGAAAASDPAWDRYRRDGWYDPANYHWTRGGAYDGPEGAIARRTPSGREAAEEARAAFNESPAGLQAEERAAYQRFLAERERRERDRANPVRLTPDEDRRLRDRFAPADANRYPDRRANPGAAHMQKTELCRFFFGGLSGERNLCDNRERSRQL